MGEFSGKVVLVTGAGRGLGRGIAEAFAAQGAIVAANDLTPVNLDETLARIASTGGQAKEYLFDIAKKMPVQAMIDQVVTDFGRLDILVNNAGVRPQAAILEMDEWDWQRTLDVNLGGAFFAIQAAGRVMRATGGGVIVNIASAESRTNGFPNQAAFVASKMGLIGLTRAAALEFAAYNIRVNAVCPGLIDVKDAHGVPPPEILQRIPQARLGSLREVVAVVLFFCSSSAAYITGQAIDVDGGMVMC